MPVRRSHPQPCVQRKKARKQVTTGTSKRSDIPCTTVLRLIRDLPGVPGFLATVPPGLTTRGLTPASGDQDHTTSPSGWPLARLAGPARPSHPAANTRDDREAPLLRRQDARSMHDFRFS
jgi:hypothetical protein